MEHTGYRNALEDPWVEAREDMYTRSVSPEQAPDKSTYLDLEFEGGNPIAIDGQKLSPATLLTQLNKVCCLDHDVDSDTKLLSLCETAQ